MRTEQVQTHFRCNQKCTHCTVRRSEDDPRFIAHAAVLGRIAAAPRGTHPDGLELVLSGGEPTMRADLPALVRAGKRDGVQVALETNATLITPALAAFLREAGLDRAIVKLSGPSAAIDAVTCDPGGFSRTLAGIDALAAAQIPVTLRATVTRPHARGLADLPPFVANRFGRAVTALELDVPTEVPIGTEADLLSWDELVPLLGALDRAARSCGVPLKLAPGSGPPPCVLGPAQAERLAYLFSAHLGVRERRGHAHVEACRTCQLRDRCPGLGEAALARFGTPQVHPITTDRARRRLSVVGTLEQQIARELATPSHHRDPVRGPEDETIVRVLFACNQACRFCFVSTHLPTPDDSLVEAAIREAASRGSKITLSGGEPTLHPRLLGFVRLARSLSALPITLQTNAIRIDRALAAALAEAGVADVFVSLHGATASTSDAVTDAPSTFERTLAGVDALLLANIPVVLNFVICARNAAELPAWVELIADRWGASETKVLGNISFVAPSSDVVPREAALVPRYADVLPHLEQAAERALARGVTLVGFESMCGLPLCLVPRSLAAFVDLTEAPPDAAGGEFVKPEPCARCSLSGKCWGVRRGYLELHGDAELVPAS